MNCLRCCGLNWQRTWMETGQKKERIKWSECCDKPRREKRQGEGTKVDPAPLGH